MGLLQKAYDISARAVVALDKSQGKDCYTVNNKVGIVGDVRYAGKGLLIDAFGVAGVASKWVAQKTGHRLNTSKPGRSPEMYASSGLDRVLKDMLA